MMIPATHPPIRLGLKSRLEECRRQIESFGSGVADLVKYQRLATEVKTIREISNLPRNYFAGRLQRTEKTIQNWEDGTPMNHNNLIEILNLIELELDASHCVPANQLPWINPPYQAFDSFHSASSDIFLPKYGVVPFQDSNALSNCLSWALDSDARFRIRCVYGKSGAGKSRLVREVGKLLQTGAGRAPPVNEWRCGVVHQKLFTEQIAQNLRQLQLSSGNLLLVVDNAGQPLGLKVIKALLALLSCRSIMKLRILIVDRTDAWKHHLARTDGECNSIFRSHAFKAAYDCQFLEPRFDENIKKQLFSKCINVYASALKIRQPDAANMSLALSKISAPAFNHMVNIHIQSLLLLHPHPAGDEDRNDVLRGVGDREMREAVNRLKASNLDPIHHIILHQVYSAIVEAGGAASPKEADKIAMVVPDYRLLPEYIRRSLLQVLHECHPKFGGYVDVTAPIGWSCQSQYDNRICVKN